MDLIRLAAAWLAANPLVVTWALGAAVALATRARTDLDWELRKLGAVRATAALQCLRAVSFDWDKLRRWLPVLLAGTPPPSLPSRPPSHPRAADAPARAATVPPPPAAPRLAVGVAAVLALAMLDCAGTLRQQAVAVSNGATAGIDAGTAGLLSAYCERSMAAIGRVGTYALGDAGARCAESGPRAGTPATAAEAAALAALRGAWGGVLDRAEAVAQAQHVLARLLAAGGAASDGAVVVALSDVVGAYEALRAAAAAGSVPVPPALTLGR